MSANDRLRVGIAGLGRMSMAHAHETVTEILGTAGRLTIGANPRLTRVDIADAHGVRNECTPTFYERFEEAFVGRAQCIR
jgi:myo-inositol 2-dehydrogenase/D-chiro-inositol 1-dehydrogenase